MSRLSNVLETVTVPKYPVIAQIKEFLMENGALGALMSGSGPTVFALFDDGQRAKQALEALRTAKLAAQTYLTSFAEHTLRGAGIADAVFFNNCCPWQPERRMDEDRRKSK